MPSKTSPGPLTITIVYNNIADDPRLATDWGFAAFIEFNDRVVLFDTGTKGQLLLQNMQTLGLDPASIQAVVLSHEHQDHIGGLPALLAVSSQPPVLVLRSFGAAYLRQLRQMTEVVETSPGLSLAEEILTTGEIPGSPPEQALLIRTSQGIVVVTGCAHPGIVPIIEKAIELTGGPIRLVLGGFHLRELTQSQVQAILADFRRLGVQQVAPSHCTGDLAIRLFAEEYGEDFIQTGAGSILIMDEGQ